MLQAKERHYGKQKQLNEDRRSFASCNDEDLKGFEVKRKKKNRQIKHEKQNGQFNNRIQQH